MKNVIFAILFVFVSFFAVSCNSNNGQVPEEDSKPDQHIMSMQLVQFKSPEFLRYVMEEKVPAEIDTIKGCLTEKLDGKESAYKIRSVGGVYQELFLGQSPYIELTEGYYLIDWKWGNFVYQPSNVLLDVMWEYVKDRQSLWELETPVVSSDFIKSWGTTDRAAIDNFLQITPAEKDKGFNVSSDHLRPIFLGLYNSFSDMPKSFDLYKIKTINDYQNEVVRQDSLQRVYRERLIKIIMDDGLKKIANLHE